MPDIRDIARSRVELQIIDSLFEMGMDNAGAVIIEVSEGKGQF